MFEALPLSGNPRLESSSCQTVESWSIPGVCPGIFLTGPRRILSIRTTPLQESLPGRTTIIAVG